MIRELIAGIGLGISMVVLAYASNELIMAIIVGWGVAAVMHAPGEWIAAVILGMVMLSAAHASEEVVDARAVYAQYVIMDESGLDRDLKAKGFTAKQRSEYLKRHMEVYSNPRVEEALMLLIPDRIRSNRIKDLGTLLREYARGIVLINPPAEDHERYLGRYIEYSTGIKHALCVDEAEIAEDVLPKEIIIKYPRKLPGTEVDTFEEMMWTLSRLPNAVDIALNGSRPLQEHQELVSAAQKRLAGRIATQDVRMAIEREKKVRKHPVLSYTPRCRFAKYVIAKVAEYPDDIRKEIYRDMAVDLGYAIIGDAYRAIQQTTQQDVRITSAGTTKDDSHLVILKKPSPRKR